jgi:hypothetical protein
VVEFAVREKTIPVGISSAADLVKVYTEGRSSFYGFFFRLMLVSACTELV